MSAILPQSDKEVMRKITETNVLLKSMCDFYNFDFMDNKNIVSDFLSNDDIHLGDVGSRYLENNFIDRMSKYSRNESTN